MLVGTPPLLEVEGLTVTFPTARGPLVALDDVTFRVDHGATVGVVGESGCGKSVLARSIMGLLDRRGAKSTGRIAVAGREVRSRPARELQNMRGRDLAIVLQDPMSSLNPVMRVGRQIAETMVRHLGYSKKKANERAVELLGLVGIPSPERRVRNYPHQLSGGMRQRVAIAIAIACEPRLLLADEPTTALDATVKAQILDLLDSQTDGGRLSLVLISHDIAEVASRSDEIVVMYAGQVVESGPTPTVLRSPRMPYTSALLRSIPPVDGPIHRRLNVIAGRPPDLVAPPRGCRFAPRCSKAGDRCRTATPPLVEAADRRHLYRCWHPNDG